MSEKTQSENMPELGRRNFLKRTSLAGAFLGLGSVSSNAEEALAQITEKLSAAPAATGKSVMNLKSAPIERVRVALLGLGMRGYGQMNVLCKLPKEKFEIVALCDIREPHVKRAEKYAGKKGFKPAVYSGSENAWQEMLRRDDIDLVIICTPWELHAPQSVYAMQHGKHVAVEVPAAFSLDDCWAMVNTAEETQRNCMMLENVCYGDEETWILNMVSQGVFGELTYGEAAYIHNLRDLLFSTDDFDGYHKQWRLKAHRDYTGNLYSTHGLGPVAQYMDIQRGDCFDYLVSMSSPQVSLTAHAKTVGRDNPFYNATDFAHGDMSTNMIKTAKGRSIVLKHDVVTPRPYSRVNALAGADAYHEGYPSRIACPKFAREQGKRNSHEWLSKRLYKKMHRHYQHPIWQKKGRDAMRAGGHGGMDYLMLYRLIDNMNQGNVWDMDVYDGMAWSVVTPLSQLSEAHGSAPIKFPDFTRGAWKQKRILPLMS